MRVLLISANTEQINMPVLPLGLAFIAASVESAGHEVKLLNLMMQADTHKAVKDAIIDSNPEIIGISVRNIDDQNMENPKFLLEAVKDVVVSCRKYSEATIVLGGAGYSIFPQAALDFLVADMGIQGEGENVFLTIMERLGDKADLSEIPGLYLPGRENQSAPGHLTAFADVPLPLPGIHLSTPSLLEDRQIWIPFQTRRGCPLDCSYCSTATIEGRNIRKHDPQKAGEAIAKYAEAGWGFYYWADPVKPEQPLWIV